MEQQEALEENKEAQPEAVVQYSYSTEQGCELPGHTETIEFCKFDASGRWLVTGGMNNLLRVWDA